MNLDRQESDGVSGQQPIIERRIKPGGGTGALNVALDGLQLPNQPATRGP